MFGQGNHVPPQFRRGPPPPPPPLPPLQQRTPPQFQQGLPPPPPRPPPPPPVYQHGPPPPRPTNLTQPIHGGAPVPVYSNPQQHPPYPPPMPPLAAPPPRVLPPPPPPPPLQGQMLYRAPPPPAPPRNQHVRALPLPPFTAPNFAPINSPFSSLVQPPPMPLPPIPPPPPPASPPPLPPSPPSSPPPRPTLTGDPGHASNKHLDDQVDHSVFPKLVEDDTHELTSNAVEEYPLKEKESADLPSPPPKPLVEEVVHNIEVLCQYIANVGPHFENMVRQKEASNSRFSFLFGGEPGSAAAIGHEYFQWMKRKYCLESGSRKSFAQSHSSLKSSDGGGFAQASSLAEEGACVSSADSDMEMEDDISEPDNDQRIKQSIRESNGGHICVKTGTLQVEKELHPPRVPSLQSLQEDATQKDACRSKSSTLFSLEGKVAVVPKASTSAGYLGSEKVASEVTAFSSNSYLQEPDKPYTVDLSLGNISSIKNEEASGVLIRDESPFKLIQGYASDDSARDDNEKNMEAVNPSWVSPKVAMEDDTLELYKDVGVKSTSVTGTGSILEGSSLSGTIGSVKSFQRVSGWDRGGAGNLPNQSDVIDKSNQQNIHMLQNVKANDGKGPHPETPPRIGREDGNADVETQIEKVHPETNEKQSSVVLNVDEFGRLVRKGASDSDTDDDRPTEGRHKRARSWSRSQSPRDSRWKKRSRSPWRRKDRRSRSRSWSPKKRSSRSKSPPSFRWMGEFSSDRLTRNKGQPQCFDFLRGRCFRGAACRYMHQDHVQGDASRRYRGRQQQYQDTAHDHRNYPVRSQLSHEVDEIKNKVEETVEKDNDSLEERKSLEISVGLDLSLSNSEATKCKYLDNDPGVGSLRDELQPTMSSEELVQAGVASAERGQNLDYQEAIAPTPGTQKVQEPPSDHFVEAMPLENSQSPPADNSLPTGPVAVGETKYSFDGSPMDQLHSGEAPEVPESQPFKASDSNSPCPELQELEIHPTGGPSTSHPLPAYTSAALQNHIPPSQPYMGHVSNTQLNQGSMGQSHAKQPSPVRLLPTQPLPSQNFSLPHSSNSYPPISHQPHLPHQPDNANASYASQPSREYHLEHQVPNFQPQPIPVNTFPPHRPPLVNSYQPRVGPPPPPSWTNLHTPPSHISEFNPRPSVPPNDFHPPNAMPQSDFRPQPSVGLSLSDEHTQTLHSVEGPRQPAPHMDQFRQNPLPMGKWHGQPFGGTSTTREEPFVHPLMNGSHQFPSGSRQDYHVNYPLQTFPGNNLPSSVFPREDYCISASGSLPYVHQPASYGQQQSTSYSGVHGGFDSSLMRPPSFQNINQPFSFPDGGLPKIMPTHYNPFTSTFEQTPGSSRFSSDPYGQQKETIDGSNHDPRRPGELFFTNMGGPSTITSSSELNSHIYTQKSAGVLPVAHQQMVGEAVIRNQYDPLHDSMEPSSDAHKTFGHVREYSSVPDIAENTKQKESMSTVTKHLYTDEFGEGGIDAEAGVVENASPGPGTDRSWSPDIPLGVENTTEGKIETNMIRSPGGHKRHKDSRSMRLFKIALADFVKEILKPSWQQGNMSKEAFKTIVKKTVDKVARAMPNNRVPKSEVKINQYVESSQRKLTKLVMGYVDKYVKMH
ncbi:Zinc finger CCCH domain-containing protein 36 [Acorus calamus]|uniref:Zinc finger CCCH domain-containing protein 36 n=1 Tax=Acorus calamus TaxID=4465 RepID=A0AAV9DCA1_ACOCL|nr:Zinc finger CCCH domain-containing protein 36 [Acorus calamus]